MKTPGNKPFAAFIGLAWADAKHDVCIQAAGDERREAVYLKALQRRGSTLLNQAVVTIQT